MKIRLRENEQTSRFGPARRVLAAHHQRGAAVALLAFVAALTMMLTTATPVAAAVVVTNVGQSVDGEADINGSDRAQSFNTGDHSAGYTLNSVSISLQTADDTTSPTVTLRSGSASGTLVATLSGPSALDANGEKVYTFTASGVTLSASTDYWVVVEDGGVGVVWKWTSSDSEDGTPASGWTIGNSSGFRTAGSTGSFSSSNVSYLLTVNATNRSDTTAPTFASATVDGTSLLITFSEDLAAAASLANSAFTVERTRGGTEAAATLSSTAPVISGKTVTLTLASAAAILATDTGVKVTYTKPTTDSNNRLEDAAGNEVDTFTDQPVTNNTGVLVSNIRQPLALTKILSSVDAAQEFTTGANAGGYTLSSIELMLDTGIGDYQLSRR